MAFDPPLGSTSPAVLLDNAKRLDELTNGPAATVPDRAGDSLKSWRLQQQEIANTLVNFQENGGAMGFSSLQELLAFTPDKANVLAVDTSTGEQYLWNGTEWVPSEYQVNSQIKSLNEIVEKSHSTKFFHRWKDRIGTIIAGWKNDDVGGVYFLSRLLKFGPNGFFGAGMQLSENEISNKTIAFKKGLDGKIRIFDKRGVMLASIENGKLQMAKMNIETMLQLAVKSGNTSLTIKKDGKGISVSDKRGVVCFRIDERGYVHGNFVNKGGSATPVLTEEQIIQQLETSAFAKQSNRFNKIFSCSPKSRKKVKVILVYGQSFAAGAQSNAALTTTPLYGNVMLGQSPRGSFFSNPPAGSEVYGPVGGENKFYPLHEVCQDVDGTIIPQSGYGETICSTVGNEFKRLHNEAMGVANDDDMVVCVGSCGVSGRSIAQLQKGASPELYNRVETFLAGVAEACAADGVEFEVIGIIYLQGENDNSASTTYYATQSQTMRQNLINSCKAASGQTFDPIYLINQIGNTYINTMGVPQAQNRLPEQADKTILVGSYQGLPNPGAHLCSNSYRKLGCLFARELWRYYSGNGDFTFRILKAVHREDKVYLSLTPRVAPLKFSAVYDKWTEILHADKGITLSDGAGTFSPEDFSVEIVSDRVIRINASRALTGAVTVSLGDKSHNGTHNISDSSNEVGGLNWVYGINGQYTQENIPSLVNKPYALNNFAAIQQIQSEEIKYVS
ncbi:TPA: sialate O-acetylesterase [Klebsiella pneumoniae]